MDGETKFDALLEEVEALYDEYSDEARETLGDDMTRYAETQGAKEAVMRIRKAAQDLQEEVEA